MLAVWLVMCMAEACPKLHAWLHGGTIPDNDDCAIVMLAQGHAEVGIQAPPALFVLFFFLILPMVSFAPFPDSLLALLPSGRAPPTRPIAG